MAGSPAGYFEPIKCGIALWQAIGQAVGQHFPNPSKLSFQVGRHLGGLSGSVLLTHGGQLDLGRPAGYLVDFDT